MSETGHYLAGLINGIAPKPVIHGLLFFGYVIRQVQLIVSAKCPSRILPIFALDAIIVKKQGVVLMQLPGYCYFISRYLWAILAAGEATSPSPWLSRTNPQDFYDPRQHEPRLFPRLE